MLPYVIAKKYLVLFFCLVFNYDCFVFVSLILYNFLFSYEDIYLHSMSNWYFILGDIEKCSANT